MASIKLTRAIKDAIRTAIKADTYKVRYEANALRKSDWESRVALHFYPESMRDKIKALPQDWFDIRNQFTVRISSIQWEYIKFETALPVPEFLTNTQAFNATDPLAEELTEIEDELKSIADEENRANIEINAILDSFSSDKQLKAAWPEVASIVDKCIGLRTSTKSGLPMVLTDHLTTKFGLPKEVAN